ncbi:uncharacterized protein [Amphiura filiformis]|uniref:uncharacterized protein n=1 Tax=Amphiura filiformis TaxID=82378 RepID=UPI003B20CAA8
MKSLEIRIGDSIIVLNGKFETFLDDQLIKTQTAELKWGTIERYRNAVKVTLNIGLTITWSSPFRAVFEVDPGTQLDGILCGLCGINNGIKRDDLETGNREVVTDIVKFADSWRTDPKCAACRDCHNTICDRNKHNHRHAIEYCNIFVNDTLPICNDDLDPKITYQQCVDSVCAFFPEFDAMCSLVLDYVVPCLFLGQQVDLTTIGVCGLCSEDEYVCANGQCIPYDWHCDGFHDCFDHSDENQIECQEFECNNDSFVCLNGDCIPPFKQCNGISECRNGEDEADCEPPTCYPDEFQCIDGTCIPGNWVCDEFDDCIDGMDEMNCEIAASPPTCVFGQSPCSTSGECIPYEHVCDSFTDCSDGSDEVNCGACMANEFECVADGGCIPDTWYCDGIEDCSDSSDEPLDVCPDTSSYYYDYYIDYFSSYSYGDPFVCNDGETIPGSWYCDDIVDCPDSEDETNCGGCDQDQWTCDNGQCIVSSWRCDAIPDCNDESDETSCTVTSYQSSSYPTSPNQPSTPTDTSPYDKTVPPSSSTESPPPPYEDQVEGEEFICDNGATSIQSNWRCDDQEDCDDGTDEVGCEGRRKRSVIQYPAFSKRSAIVDIHPNKRCSKIWRLECDALLPYSSTSIVNQLLRTNNRKHVDRIYKHIMSATNVNKPIHQFFACAVAFPECPDEKTGKYTVPCRHLCRNVFAAIGHHFHGMKESAWPVHCNDLPDEESQSGLCTAFFEGKRPHKLQ